MIAAGLVIAVVAAVVLALGLVVAGTRDDPDRWATTNGVVLTDATRPVVAGHLQTAMWLRRVGAIGGVVLPPAITAATGIDIPVSGLVWILLGYLLGQLVAELWLARVAIGPRRTVSLERRRLGDYLPRSALLVQLALPPVLVILGVAVAATAVAPLDDRVSSVGGPAGPLVAGAVAGALVGVVLLGERRLVRRPRPWADADLVAVDDAMRSWSIRVVAASTVALGSLVISAQLAVLAGRAGSRLVEGLLWVGAAGVLALALAGWVAWVQRGWSVERDRHANAEEVVA